MQVIPFKWDDSVVQIDALGEQSSSKRTSTSYGIASFPAGIRHPQDGYAAHEGTEVSFILDGLFDVETPDGVVTVTKDNLVIIPAGEPHATLARSPGRVVYFLINEIQE